MKPLRPITIVVAGPLVAGVAVSVVAAAVGHDAWTPRSCFIWFVVGAAQGALTLAPIAAAEAFRPTLAELLRPHIFGIQWYISLTMAVAFGYLLASMRQRGFDGFAGFALAVECFGAMIKMTMGILYEHTGERTA